MGDALGTPSALAYVRQRLAERVGTLSRDAGREVGERSARLERTEERIRGLITMQADGDRSPMVAQMRADLEANAEQERDAIGDLRELASAPIRLPPVDLLTERVFSLRALAEPTDIQRARTALRSYFKGGSDALRAWAGRALSTSGCAGAMCTLDNGIVMPSWPKREASTQPRSWGIAETAQRRLVQTTQGAMAQASVVGEDAVPKAAACKELKPLAWRRRGLKTAGSQRSARGFR